MLSAVDIADAVAAELNAAPAGTFTPALAATRMLVPVFEPADLEELRVTVVPATLETVMSTRQLRQRDITVTIGVQQRVVDIEKDVRALTALVEGVDAYLSTRRQLAGINAFWVSSSVDPLYAVEHIAQLRTLTGVIRATYRVMSC